MNHNIFSFFSNAGFLDYGFESEGFDVVYVNEYHKPFLDAYNYARKQLKITNPQYVYYGGSITDFSELELNTALTGFVNDSRQDGSLVGFIGGSPFPDFSVAGVLSFIGILLQPRSRGFRRKA